MLDKFSKLIQFKNNVDFLYSLLIRSQEIDISIFNIKSIF